MGRAGWVLVAGLLFSLSAVLSVQAGAIDPDLQSVLSTAGSEEAIPVIITLADQADIHSIHGLSKADRRLKIIKSLQSQAAVTQQPLRRFLGEKKASRIIPLWLFNGMAVTAKAGVINELSVNPRITSIRLDYAIPEPKVSSKTSEVAGWNISRINAPELWALGYTGQGIVIASMDSGVDVNHPDLKAQWRGGTNSWYDPNDQHDTPFDADGHGTQTMGVMVGGDTSGTAIGVAPGAEWIGVKIFNDDGKASYSAIHQGYQWLLDPDDSPDTDDAPDIVNNSWDLDNINGCSKEFQPDIQVLNAAGIAVVFAGGNYGPGSSTSISPANNTGILSVGATDEEDRIVYGGSQGPSACDGTIYPLISAPGDNIYTTDLSFGGKLFYRTVSGTSYAAPHVSGALALLMSAYPAMDVSLIESALINSGLDLGDAGPDNTYGYGLIDVLQAYTWLQEGACSTWSDVITKYSEYVAGQSAWNDVMVCYNRYTSMNELPVKQTTLKD